MLDTDLLIAVSYLQTGLFTSEAHDYFIHPIPTQYIDSLKVESTHTAPHIVFRRSIRERFRRNVESSSNLFNKMMDQLSVTNDASSCGTKGWYKIQLHCISNCLLNSCCKPLQSARELANEDTLLQKLPQTV